MSARRSIWAAVSRSASHSSSSWWARRSLALWSTRSLKTGSGGRRNGDPHRDLGDRGGLSRSPLNGQSVAPTNAATTRLVCLEVVCLLLDVQCPSHQTLFTNTRSACAARVTAASVLSCVKRKQAAAVGLFNAQKPHADGGAFSQKTTVWPFDGLIS